MSERDTHIPVIDNFLYLHPSENPSVSLVSPVLDSTNYHSWSRSMMTALSAKNKLEFVDGGAAEPLKTDRTYGAWKRSNNMVVSWIIHSVSMTIRQNILWMNKAEEIWKDLKSRYAQSDLLRISDLRQEATSIRQGNLSVTEYFTKLRIIWDELENFRPDPTCTCNSRCTCIALKTVAQRKREDRAIQFLRGLNEQFGNVRSHVLPMDPLPEISRIFSYVAQQEKQLGNSLINVNSIEMKHSLVNAAKLVCNYCGMTGHTESVCYKKHGMPSGSNERNKMNSFRNYKICTYCGKTGHTVEVCYKKYGFPPGFKFSNSRSSGNSLVTRDEAITNDQTQQIEPKEIRFSPEQYKALLALIQQPSEGNSDSMSSSSK
ncbi:Retrovirus-related Pol polyprotein from transposon RE1 [Glycine soja]